jgi:hypothetical protein
MTRLISVLAVAAIASAITVKTPTKVSEQAEVKSPYHAVKASCAVWEDMDSMKYFADFKTTLEESRKAHAIAMAIHKCTQQKSN